MCVCVCVSERERRRESDLLLLQERRLLLPGQAQNLLLHAKAATLLAVPKSVCVCQQVCVSASLCVSKFVCVCIDSVSVQRFACVGVCASKQACV